MAELSTHAPLVRRHGASGRGKGSRSAQRKGEAQQATAAGLDLLRVLGWLVLHDAAVPDDPDISIDHVLAGPSGVYVVNTVGWAGPISVDAGVLTVGGTDRHEAVADVAAAAEVVRRLLGAIPVAPLLCFERLEAVTGVADDVALCASENILDLLTSQPEILDPASVARASRGLSEAFRPVDRRRVRAVPAVVEPGTPTSEPSVDHLARTGVEDDVEPEGVAPAKRPQTAGDVARVEALESLMGGTPRPAAPVAVPVADEAHRKHRFGLRRGSKKHAVAEEPTVEVSETAKVAGLAEVTAIVEPVDLVEPAVADTSAAVRSSDATAVGDAGAALWLSLTDAPEAPATDAESDAESDVELALAEAEARRQAAEAEERERVEREAAEARERAEQQARERAEQEAEDARRREADEVRKRAAQEARENLERQARELAERERLEQEAREQTEREEAARLERERLEREAREQAEREEAARLERERLEREAREQAEREEAERLARLEQERLEREAREQAEREEAERLARLERERLEREAREQAEREEAERLARLEQERLEREARERAEREEAARLEQERLEREAREQAEREEAERLARLEQERLEREARERAEREEAARLEQERLEREAREQAEREEAARLEQERLEREAREQAEREQAERLERERAEEVTARAAWQARLQAGREARATAADMPASPDEQVAMMVSRHPDVRRAEVLQPTVAREPGVPVVAETAVEEPVAEQTLEPEHATCFEPEPETDVELEPEATPAFTPLSVEAEVDDWEPEVVAAPAARRTDYGIRKPAPAAADAAPAESERRRRLGHGLSKHALMQVAVAGLLIAGVIVGGPRVGDVVAWGQDLFAKDQPTTVGTAVTLDATTYHPAGTALAGAPVPVQATAGAGAAKGEHLVAVPLRIRNDGAARWDVPVAAEAAIVDVLGVSHPVVRTVKAVKGYPLLPAMAKIAPGTEITGYAVFSVPNGRDLRSVSLGLAKTGNDTVTWQVSP